MSDHPHPSRLDAFDSLFAGERREVLAHVETCAACREAWVKGDPSRLFALLALDAVPETLLDEVSSGVNDALDPGRAARPGSVPFGALRAVGAVAAGLVLGVLIYALSGRPDVDVGPAAVPVAYVEVTPPASVAVLESPGQAQVIDLTVGDSQLVMIFDQELDL